MRYLEELKTREHTGVPTFIPALDAALLPFRQGSVNIICGETSNGKSSLAMTIALAQARKRVQVAFASLEIPLEEFESKLVSNIAGVSFKRVEESQRPDSADSDRVWEAVKQRALLPLYVMDCASLSLEKLANALEEFVNGKKADIIYVDYLQLMTGEGRSREQEVAKLSRGLKRLARKMRIPVVALSQLRRVDPRVEDHRPTLERLRDSGQLEQDASVVLGVYWPHRYGDTIETEFNEKLPAPWGEAEVSILKQRNGPCKLISAQVDWESGRWLV